ncbi:Inositol 1, 3, 4-trisphosphate 5/6-kinase [Musa troglodytarum]|uniref:inositol-1,3,4-trisphosphate 5/6-kinase n=1 Tax=Musa troglodytarum TaxID=320322 RepID=A0A9E7JE55_9LILI|nr:Inositol 1, 3, 4-trisphosphate 5/6-kinase [Musa troglodytarum]
MGAVRGVLLDESVLLSDDGSGNPRLKPGAEVLLRRLRYSNLRVGFCHHEDLSAVKAIFLQNTARIYSFSCVSLDAPDAKYSFNQLLLDWGIARDNCFYVTSKRHDAFTHEIQNQGWLTVCVGVDSGSVMNKEFLFINKLEELLITVCSLSKKRGALPMYPTQNGLIFVPLTFEIPLVSQLQDVDAVLHKATDEIIDNFHEPNLRDQLSEANLSFPIIVKPQIACGVGDAHSMALVFKFEDFKEICVPLPAILQSLPVATDDQFSVGRLQADIQSLDVDLVKSAANWLKTELDLTIFGFDVVIQEDTGDHVIVDLNYLPSFKEVPDTDAIPAFWTAIKSAHEARKTN